MKQKKSIFDLSPIDIKERIRQKTDLDEEIASHLATAIACKGLKSLGELIPKDIAIIVCRTEFDSDINSPHLVNCNDISAIIRNFFHWDRIISEIISSCSPND